MLEGMVLHAQMTPKLASLIVKIVIYQVVVPQWSAAFSYYIVIINYNSTMNYVMDHYELDVRTRIL